MRQHASQLHRRRPDMKTATIPSLRVDPALREAAESVLDQGETLSSFVESALRMGIDQRRAHREFIARGLASYAAASQRGDFKPAADVIQTLEQRLAAAKAKARK